MALNMDSSGKTVIGVDVGGPKKGFHAVALRGGEFECGYFKDCSLLLEWCLEYKAHVIAIDAPCAWAISGSSRSAERELYKRKIHCFKTPTRKHAEEKRKHTEGESFYSWVFNGEILYKQLQNSYDIFDGVNRDGKIVIETFPHAIVCELSGCVISARQKSKVRRNVLCCQGYNPNVLPNIDFVDAALCALTAERFLLSKTISYGDSSEGFIVLPKFQIFDSCLNQKEGL